MNKHLKLFGIICILSLLTLTLTGCENPPWEAGMTLVVKIDSPEEGAKVNTPTITVSGRLTGTEASGATVKVNEKDALVKDGKYSAEVTLSEGKNVINISARGGQANIAEQRTVTYASAK